MGLLHWMFAIITGKSGRNWVSIKFNKWQSQERERVILSQRNNRDSPNYIYINTRDGQCLRISKTNNYGDNKISNAFDFGVEWGEFGFEGTLLNEQSSLELASHILTTLNYDYWIPNRNIKSK